MPTPSSTRAKLSILTAKLGEGSVYRELSLKPFCSAKQALAATEAVASLIDDGEVNPSEITKIIVRVPPPYARTRPDQWPGAQLARPRETA